MRCRTVAVIFCCLIFACQEEQKTDRSLEPPPSPKAVAPATETKAEAAPPPKAPAAKAPKRVKSAAKSTVTPPVPRPTTLSPTNGAALGGSKSIRLVQLVNPSAQVKPEASIRITSPKPGDVLRRSTLKLSVQLKNFIPEKLDDGRGRWLRVVLDNEEARDWYDPDDSAFQISGVSPGWHTVRVFAIDHYGECVKDTSAFDAINFFVRTDKGAPKPIDFSEPLLTYNLPKGTYAGDAARRIPLDFHLGNAQLSKDGYRVRVQVGALPPFELTAWTPVYLQDVPSGTHTLLLTLLGPNGEALSHPWNPLERQFTVSN